MKKFLLPFQIDASLVIRVIIISLLILVLIGGCTTSRRASPDKNLTPPSQSTLVQKIKITSTPTPTPDLPPNWDDSGEQTNGIVLVGILLVMIVVIGTYSGIRRPS
jgi:hypothetical protein